MCRSQRCATVRRRFVPPGHVDGRYKARHVARVANDSDVRPDLSVGGKRPQNGAIAASRQSVPSSVPAYTAPVARPPMCDLPAGRATSNARHRSVALSIATRWSRSPASETPPRNTGHRRDWACPPYRPRSHDPPVARVAASNGRRTVPPATSHVKRAPPKCRARATANVDVRLPDGGPRRGVKGGRCRPRPRTGSRRPRRGATRTPVALGFRRRCAGRPSPITPGAAPLRRLCPDEDQLAVYHRRRAIRLPMSLSHQVAPGPGPAQRGSASSPTTTRPSTRAASS